MDNTYIILYSLLMAHISATETQTGFFIVEEHGVSYQEASDVCLEKETYSILASIDDTFIEYFNNGSLNISNIERKSNFMWIKDAIVSELGHGCETNRCRNGGMCIVNDTDSVCLCENGFTGDLCQHKNCLIQHCKNNGTCEDTWNGYQCNCTENFHGRLCEIQGCTPGRCSNRGSCKFVNENVYCNCSYPYFGRFCELNNNTDLKYLGCFKNNIDRILDEANFDNRGNNSPFECARKCALVGKRFIGLEAQTQCFCGNHILQNITVSNNQCLKKCAGNSIIGCGGSWRSSVYEIIGLQNLVNRSLEDCRFRKNNECFIQKPIYRNDWKHEYYSKEEDSGVIEFQPSQNLGIGIYAIPVTVNVPKCLRFTYYTEGSEVKLRVYQIFDDLGLQNHRDLNFTWKSKFDNVPIQLALNPFSTIVFVANGSQYVRINDVEFQLGYCDCSKSLCVPGKLCYESMSATCCPSQKGCTVQGAKVLLHNGKLQCTFKEPFPCFVGLKSGEWGRENDTAFPGIKLLSQGDLNNTTGILESVYLPARNKNEGCSRVIRITTVFAINEANDPSLSSPVANWSRRIMYSLFCLTFSYEKSPEAFIEVALLSEEDTESTILLDSTWSLEINTTIIAQIEMGTKEQSKIQIKGKLRPNNDKLLVRRIVLEEGSCLNDTVQCNSIFLRDKGSLTQIIPVGADDCQWSVRVEKGHGIEFTLEDDISDKNCTANYWQFLDVKDKLNITSCGGGVMIPQDFVTVKYVKQITSAVRISLTWRKVVRYCPALYTSNDQVFLINISCNERIMGVACQKIPPTTTMKEKATTGLADTSFKRDTQTEIDSSILIPAVCAPIVLCVVAAMLAIIVIKRRRTQNTKDSDGQSMIYVNESSSVPQEKDVYMNDTYRDSVPNAENIYINTTDPADQGQGKHDIKRPESTENNEEYDHLAFDGIKKNAAQNNTNNIYSEMDSSYGTLHGNHLKEQQQGIYDVAGTSNENNFKDDQVVYATPNKVRGISKTSKHRSTTDIPDQQAASDLNEGNYDQVTKR